MSDDPTTHYMQATDRMRQRAERAEAEVEQLREEGATLEGTFDSYERKVQSLAAEVERLRAERDAFAFQSDALVERTAYYKAEFDQLRAEQDAWITHTANAQAEVERLREENTWLRDMIEDDLQPEVERLRRGINDALTDLLAERAELKAEVERLRGLIGRLVIEAYLAGRNEAASGEHPDG